MTLRRLLCRFLLSGMPALPAAPASDLDWLVIRQQYREIEWIAGLSGESATNGNEWNGAEGRPAVEAELSEPHSAMADLSGAIYIADKNAHAIRKIRPDGVLVTVAGTNAAGFDGDGPATQRQLDGPQHAYVLPDGTFYILDTGNRRIRRVGTDGEMVTTVMETADLSRGLWVSRDERVIYYATTKALKKWTPALGTRPGEVLATGLVDAGNLDVAANGDIFISDRGASRVYRVPPSHSPGTPLVPVGGLGGNAADGPRASGQPALSVGLREVRGVAFHPAGGYFVATHRGGDVWYIDTRGIAWMFIEGDTGATFLPTPQPVPTTRQVMAEPRSVSVALNGDILICGNDAGYVRRIRYTGPQREPAAELAVTVGPAGSPVVRWRVGARRWFRLESTADLSGGDWTTEQSGPATGEWQDWVGPGPESTARFYRLTEFRQWPN
jgi:DNA-binding beta-propeller fold protein YncE